MIDTRFRRDRRIAVVASLAAMATGLWIHTATGVLWIIAVQLFAPVLVLALVSGIVAFWRLPDAVTRRRYLVALGLWLAWAATAVLWDWAAAVQDPPDSAWGGAIGALGRLVWHWGLPMGVAAAAVVLPDHSLDRLLHGRPGAGGLSSLSLLPASSGEPGAPQIPAVRAAIPTPDRDAVKVGVEGVLAPVGTAPSCVQPPGHRAALTGMGVLAVVALIALGGAFTGVPRTDIASLIVAGATLSALPITLVLAIGWLFVRPRVWVRLQPDGLRARYGRTDVLAVAWGDIVHVDVVDYQDYAMLRLVVLDRPLVRTPSEATVVEDGYRWIALADSKDLEVLDWVAAEIDARMGGLEAAERLARSREQRVEPAAAVADAAAGAEPATGA